jgi:hypothetical protein
MVEGVRAMVAIVLRPASGASLERPYGGFIDYPPLFAGKRRRVAESSRS